MAPGSIAAALLGSFLASLVECVEALTVVLAVGRVRGWRPACAGAAAALLVLAGIVAACGPALAVLELRPLRLAVGGLLLLFGLRWLRKAVLRAAGVVARHDEAREFAETTARLRNAGSPHSARWDGTAILASFNIVMLEGIEVVFIVTAFGTGHGPTSPALLEPAIIGAGSAALCVIGLGLLLHRPLAKVPENALKFAVSVLLSSVGLFWLGEALGLAWPGGDVALLVLVGGYGSWALVLVGVCRRAAVKRATGARQPTAVTAARVAGVARAAARWRAPEPATGTGPAADPPAAPPRRQHVGAGGPLAQALRRCIALFVDDRWLGIGVIAWIASAALLLGRPPDSAGALALGSPWGCALFALGPALLLGYRTVRAAAMVFLSRAKN
jgi:uncharacterized membrane protein